jgi:aspartyl-tRNA(Asn)/glutamyl-tRNA(Gln) amidotransferase subunit A
MATDGDLAFKPAYELRELIGKKRLSPVELTDFCLRRIEALNPKLNAFLLVTAELARKQAREAEQAVMKGEKLGPLHGIPIPIKDLVPTKGIRTTMGSLAYKDWVPDYDEVVMERTLAAGAVILGKTNLPEFGMSGTTENKLGEPCRNPWDLERSPGGSSGGAAAAVAAGLSPIAQGGDGGGSIRIPASFSGIYGIKPTQGRAPRKARSATGWHPVQFAQHGPLSWTVRDSAIYLQVMAGPHPEDPHCIQEPAPDLLADLDKGVKGLKMAWSADYGGGAWVEPEVATICEKAAKVFAELGASVEPSPLSLDVPALYDAYHTITSVSLYVAHGYLLEEHRNSFMGYVRRDMEAGARVTGEEYARALTVLEKHRRAMAEFFTKYDILLTPTMPVTALRVNTIPVMIGGKDASPMGFWSYLPFTFPINMSGGTAASVPAGFASDGLPVGLHIIADRGKEALVFQVSAAFEKARPWANKRPPVS